MSQKFPKSVDTALHYVLVYPSLVVLVILLAVLVPVGLVVDLFGVALKQLIEEAIDAAEKLHGGELDL